VVRLNILLRGQDVQAHENDIELLSVKIRNWLNELETRKVMPGGKRIYEDYTNFIEDLPIYIKELDLELSDLTMMDYQFFVSKWLRENRQ